MRKMVASFVLGCVVAVVGPKAVRAAEDAEHVTNEPAATLLLPYFEALVPAKIGKKANGVNTFFSINNASASAAIAHVTIWSDLAVPVIGFDVYLTGFDVQRISMQDILNGKLPLTADDGADPQDFFNPADGISNQGILSQDINFPGASGPCTAQTLYSEPLPVESVQHIRAALTGKFSPLLGGCFGLDHGDKKPIARGFVTIDSVTQCTTLNPGDPGYASGGIADNRNILWGDYEIIDKSKKIAVSDALVHVRAEPNDPAVQGAAQYTFYSRYDVVSGHTFRQPLATKFAAPYVNTPEARFPQGTSLIVWRDPKKYELTTFACGTTPSWYPLDQDEVLAFDEQENVEVVQADPKAFGAATQKVKIDGPTLPISFDAGWLYLNLNTFVDATLVPLEDPLAAQAWVTVAKDNKTKFSGGTRAVTIDSATAVIHSQLSN